MSSLADEHWKPDRGGTEQLLGQQPSDRRIVEVRVFADHLEVWYGGQKMQQLPRLRGRTNYRIDYRHIVNWLVRKPGAFAGYRYREHLFPSSHFRMAYDWLQTTMRGRCDRHYLQILELAANRERLR